MHRSALPAGVAWILAVGLLVAVVATGLLVDVPTSGCDRAGCAPSLVGEPAAGDRHVPAHDPCTGDPVCGGAGAAVHAIAIGIAGLAGLLLIVWGGRELVRVPAAVARSAVVPGGVEHPPRRHG